MKQVVVRPERCVGCMQCMVACAVEHSSSKNLYEAVFEAPLPAPRVHVAYAPGGGGFPNRCRHCVPAPCVNACFPGALSRDKERDTVLVDDFKCIRCASCAMACPFGVIRFHVSIQLPSKTVAQKCDNCIQRISVGKVPACVEACKTKALIFEDINIALQKRTQEVARAISKEIREEVVISEAWSTRLRFLSQYEGLRKVN